MSRGSNPERVPRGPLPERRDPASDGTRGMTHDELVQALRAVDGLVDVGHDPPNFHLRGRPFLHFHEHADGTYADVRLGPGDFEPVWAGSPQERLELFALVCDHVDRIHRPHPGPRGHQRRR